jgi:hypothetical protein
MCCLLTCCHGVTADRPHLVSALLLVLASLSLLKKTQSEGLLFTANQQDRLKVRSVYSGLGSCSCNISSASLHVDGFTSPSTSTANNRSHWLCWLTTDQWILSTLPQDEASMFLQNIRIYLQVHEVSQPARTNKDIFTDVRTSTFIKAINTPAL